MMASHKVSFQPRLSFSSLARTVLTVADHSVFPSGSRLLAQPRSGPLGEGENGSRRPARLAGPPVARIVVIACALWACAARAGAAARPPTIASTGDAFIAHQIGSDLWTI